MALCGRLGRWSRRTHRRLSRKWSWSWSSLDVSCWAPGFAAGRGGGHLIRALLLLHFRSQASPLTHPLSPSFFRASQSLRRLSSDRPRAWRLTAVSTVLSTGPATYSCTMRISAMDESLDLILQHFKASMGNDLYQSV